MTGVCVNAEGGRPQLGTARRAPIHGGLGPGTQSSYTLGTLITALRTPAFLHPEGQLQTPGLRRDKVSLDCSAGKKCSKMDTRPKDLEMSMVQSQISEAHSHLHLKCFTIKC